MGSGRHRVGGGLRAVCAAAALALVATGAVGCSSDGSATAATTSTARTSATAAGAGAGADAVGGTGGVTISPDPVPVGPSDTGATVRVSWTDQAPHTLIFVRICRKSVADPTFRPGIDCSLLSELTPNGTADGAGTIDLQVFRGENPDGDSGWGCYAPTDRPGPGIQRNTTCYVRVTNDVIGNAKDQRDAPFTFTVR